MNNAKLFKKRIIAAIVGCCLLLTGCWDKVEINHYAFVMGLGLDKNEDMLKATYSTPNLPIITGQGGEGEKNFIKETEGRTLLEANNNFVNISNQKLTFDHTKIIVLGDSFLQDPKMLKKTIDYFIRSPQYALSLLLITTDKDAKQLLQAKPNSDKPIGIYIYEIFKGNETENLADYKMSLLDFITGLEETKGIAILPRIVSKDKEVCLDGLTILKDYKKCVQLSQQQMIPFNWLRGRGKGIYVSEKENQKIKKVSYQISQISRSVTFKKEKLGMKININIELEGDIIEYELNEDDKSKSLYKDTNIKELEKVIKEGMEEEMNKLLNIIQNDIGVDIINLSNDMKIHEGKLWEEVKDYWNAYFASSKIEVEVIPKVRRIGMTK